MANNESTFKNMVVTLFLVTFISSAALGLVYKLTEDPIKKAKFHKKNKALTIVLTEFNNQPFQEVDKVLVDNDTVKVYTGKFDDSIVGYAVEASTAGYGGEIKLLVGFWPGDSIKEVAVLEHKETAGLGDKILKSKSDFAYQFEGKNPSTFKLMVKKDGGEVDAITASTITSRAYCNGLQKAYKGLNKVKD